MDIDLHKIATSPFVAGVLGAVVGLKGAPGLSWQERFTNVIAGSAIALFVAPAVGEFFRLTSPSMLGLLAFALGMFGMSIAAAILQWLRDGKLGEAISSWTVKK